MHHFICPLMEYNNVQDFQLLYNLTNTCYFLFLDSIHPNGWEREGAFLLKDTNS